MRVRRRHRQSLAQRRDLAGHHRAQLRPGLAVHLARATGRRGDQAAQLPSIRASRSCSIRERDFARNRRSPTMFTPTSMTASPGGRSRRASRSRRTISTSSRPAATSSCSSASARCLDHAAPPSGYTPARSRRSPGLPLRLACSTAARRRQVQPPVRRRARPVGRDADRHGRGAQPDGRPARGHAASCRPTRPTSRSTEHVGAELLAPRRRTSPTPPPWCSVPGTRSRSGCGEAPRTSSSTSSGTSL